MDFQSSILPNYLIDYPIEKFWHKATIRYCGHLSCAVSLINATSRQGTLLCATRRRQLRRSLKLTALSYPKVIKASMLQGFINSSSVTQLIMNSTFPPLAPVSPFVPLIPS